MGKVINLSDRLTNEKPVIVIDKNHQYIVKNDKNTAIYLKEISESEEISDFGKNDKTDNIIKIALGEDALEYLKTLDLSVSGWNLIVEAIMAAINEVPLEEVEKEAEKAAKQAVKSFPK